MPRGKAESSERPDSFARVYHLQRASSIAFRGHNEVSEGCRCSFGFRSGVLGHATWDLRGTAPTRGKGHQHMHLVVASP